jgi:hypothetical protein
MRKTAMAKKYTNHIRLVIEDRTRFRPGIQDNARTGRQIRRERRRSNLKPRYNAQRKSEPNGSGAVDRNTAQKTQRNNVNMSMLSPISTSANRMRLGSLRNAFIFPEPSPPQG